MSILGPYTLSFRSIVRQDNYISTRKVCDSSDEVADSQQDRNGNGENFSLAFPQAAESVESPQKLGKPPLFADKMYDKKDRGRAMGAAPE